MSAVAAGAAPGAAGLGRARLTVAGAYAAQGFGYAVVVTALPGLKERQHIDDTAVSLIILLVCLAAAAGSVLAGRVASARSSRVALVLGFALQAVALPAIAGFTAMVPYVVAFFVYGVGLGAVDAAAGMQGVIVQHRLGRVIMSGFFACYTAAAIGGALLMSGLAERSSAVVIALLVAAAVMVSIALAGRRGFYGQDVAVEDVVENGPAARAAAGRADGAPPDSGPSAARAVDGDRRPGLGVRSGVWLFGTVVLVAFVADSAVSTWSTVYLGDTLGATARIAPLGYAVYQATILVSRLVGDVVVRRVGRAPVVAVTATAAALGFVLVGTVSTSAAALVGFAVVGVGVGFLVPLSFSAAGELDPRRTDQVIAQLNLFNYVGAVFGGVVVGLVSDGLGLGPAFLLPAVLLVPAVLIARWFGGRVVGRVAARPAGAAARASAEAPEPGVLPLDVRARAAGE